MNYVAQYFKLAQAEETTGNKCAALPLYLSSFCDSFHSSTRDYPCGATTKIRNLQRQLRLSDLQLAGLVHSYGPLTDTECQKLL